MLFAFSRADLLGIINTTALGQSPATFEKLTINQDRRCHHRTCKGAAADFVNPDETGKPVDLLEIETAQVAAFHPPM